MKLFNYISQNKNHILIIILIILIAGITHGFNMFNFPYYENDEGAYMSQAWSIINLGKLTPYTYWYDHAPAGWVLISIWSAISGFFTFGISVNSGRVLMLLIHITSSVMVFFITKKITKNNISSLLAVSLFSFSALGIYFQRRVLLDNIMIFWALLSTAFLFVGKLRLRHIILSAVCLGIAILTKENAVFFIPALLYAVYINSHKQHKNIALFKWISIVVSIVSVYFLYALLKGELFPVGFFGDSAPHTSLIGTLKEQLSRGKGLPFWNKESDFYLNFLEWIRKDTVIIFGGTFALFVNLFLSVKIKLLRIPVLMSLFFLVFLLRGKLVIDFYIIPLIPLFAINIAVVINFISKNVSFDRRSIFTIISVYLAIILVGAQIFISRDHYIEDETTPQLLGYDWVIKNISKESIIVVDDFAEADYRREGYRNAFWFYKVWEDPEIQAKYEYDWRKINYIFLTHELVKQMGGRDSNNDVIRTALANSTRVAMFGPNDPSTYLNLQTLKSTNGDWAAIYKVDGNKQVSQLWDYYKTNFIASYGQSIDTSREFKTTSEGQSYIMLRSVFENDKDMFVGSWSWTRDHLQTRTQDNLISWLWGEKDGKEQIVESANATDADLDIALALILASRRWGIDNYEKEALSLIEDIWDNSVVRVNGRYYLLAGEGFRRDGGYIMNPSYFSPATYKLFAQIDKTNPWRKLAEDSYYTLEKINDMDENNTDLPTNWVYLNNRGELKSAENYIEESPDFYGFDAFRVFWRVALDAKWFKSKQAIEYLEGSETFFRKEFDKNKDFKSIYNLNGASEVNYSNMSIYAGPLSIFSVTDKKLADQIFKKLIESKFNNNGYWGDGKNYYDQNWVWFGTALYSNNLPLYKQ